MANIQKNWFGCCLGRHKKVVNRFFFKQKSGCLKEPHDKEVFKTAAFFISAVY